MACSALAGEHQHHTLSMKRTTLPLRQRCLYGPPRTALSTTLHACRRLQNRQCTARPQPCRLLNQSATSTALFPKLQLPPQRRRHV